MVAESLFSLVEVGWVESHLGFCEWRLYIQPSCGPVRLVPWDIALRCGERDAFLTSLSTLSSVKVCEAPANTPNKLLPVFAHGIVLWNTMAN